MKDSTIQPFKLSQWNSFITRYVRSAASRCDTIYILPSLTKSNDSVGSPDMLKWPTPKVSSANGPWSNRKGGGIDLQTAVHLRAQASTADASVEIIKTLNPLWVEWLMGYPADWTCTD